MSKAVKAHGMDGTLAKPDWPPLTLAEVRSMLRAFSRLGEPVRIISSSPRPFSAASVLSTRAGRVFVKRHHRSVRDVEGLLEEHRFLAYAKSHGAAVPEVLSPDSGETAIALREWTYEVHEAPVGVDLYQDAFSWTQFRSFEHARSAGEALARLHIASAGYDSPRRNVQPLVAGFTIFAAPDPRVELTQYIAARPALGDWLAGDRCCEVALELLAPLHAELRPLLPALSPLWTHNDLHASNLLWSSRSSSARATAIIDFGLSDRTNAVHDLAQAIERNIVGWLDLSPDVGHSENISIHSDALIALLEGYESVRPLSPEERAALAPMTALCHAEFALSEADYFWGVLRSASKARLATDGYLVGHARWFRGPAGARLLNEMRRWAESPMRSSQRAACS